MKHDGCMGHECEFGRPCDCPEPEETKTGTVYAVSDAPIIPEGRDLLDDREFYEFMYDYRCAPRHKPDEVVAKFEAVKDYIRFHCIVPWSIEDVVNHQADIEGHN